MPMFRRRCLPLLLLTLVTTACAPNAYRAADVQPVEVMPQPGGAVLIRYHVPATTAFHSPGADVHTARNGSREVILRRCRRQQPCAVTHPASATAGDPLQRAVLLEPGSTIIMVYRDTREQVFPAPPAAAAPSAPSR